ncbi:unnamed protein product [Medioppia subpectinata]|uniref:ABC transporter domain-containing protein n=1 Tax=Medioppia subpectinata TaxID=1979941 RepID=A0A7R9KUJ5_9ACAR|nr:unnamed protein product [Medioppia subpectinata]CAG2109986.1 unnamed protein product [Medioppia subpectinata]
MLHTMSAECVSSPVVGSSMNSRVDFPEPEEPINAFNDRLINAPEMPFNILFSLPNTDDRTLTVRSVHPIAVSEVILYSKELNSKSLSLQLNVIVNKYMNEGYPENLIILDNINGEFVCNSLNALMGPSGAGKTTLLKFRTCFIQSDVCEHLLSGLTVRQTLLYASKLKNSRIMDQLNDNKIVEELMSDLMISDTADNRVESCSGGEQKRIVIACELTSHIKPNMLCIDEPTSGLDSNAAEVVINCLKALSRRHEMTIIASIHQPNNDLFNMFDNIYVLAKGGVKTKPQSKNC